MARKKSSRNRPNLPQATLDRARQEVTGSPVQTTAAAPARKNKAPAPAPEAVHQVTMDDLAKEYAYVVTDLRNMGLLAGALFAVLIILAIIF